jgi:hypothetical protein
MHKRITVAATTGTASGQYCGAGKAGKKESIL